MRLLYPSDRAELRELKGGEMLSCFDLAETLIGLI